MAGRLQNVPVLAVQIEFCTRLENRKLGRQENREALLQQTAEDFLGRQVPTFTVSAGRRGRCCRERLWHQLAKLLCE